MNSYGFCKHKKENLKNNHEYHEICLENKRKIPENPIKKENQIICRDTVDSMPNTTADHVKKKKKEVKKRRKE